MGKRKTAEQRAKHAAYMREYNRDPEHAAKKQVQVNAWAKRNPDKRAAYRKAWSDANPNYKHERLVRHRAAMTAFKLAAGCADCGLKPHDASLLHFHHVDPSTKLFNVSSAALRAQAVIDAEIAKCAVLCQPCHAARHRPN